MKISYPLTIYYDASCTLCNSEMQSIKANDVNDILELRDCSSPEFDDSAFRPAGITRDSMMNCLHAQDSQGRWFKGVTAFEIIYRSVGMASIANMWGHPWIRPITTRAYPWIVRYRYVLSALGLHKVFNLWSKRAARKANLRSQSCRDGRCTLSK